MAYRLTPIIKEVMRVLKKHGVYIVRVRGDHIVVNKDPSLSRPIILVNEKRLSNAVRLNLLNECGIDKKEFEGIF